MDKSQTQVNEFMRAAGQDIPAAPRIPTDAERILRVRLLMEEVLELANDSGILIRDAITGQKITHIDNLNLFANPYASVNLVGVADSLADVKYVNEGAATTYGLDLEPIFEEVHRANMEKFGPGGFRRADGKWQKPPDWEEPNIQNIVELQQFQGNIQKIGEDRYHECFLEIFSFLREGKKFDNMDRLIGTTFCHDSSEKASIDAEALKAVRRVEQTGSEWHRRTLHSLLGGKKNVDTIIALLERIPG